MLLPQIHRIYICFSLYMSFVAAAASLQDISPGFPTIRNATLLRVFSGLRRVGLSWSIRDWGPALDQNGVDE